MWPAGQPWAHPHRPHRLHVERGLQSRRQDPGLGEWGQDRHLWDVASRKPLGHRSPATPTRVSVAFSPDGKTLASGSRTKLSSCGMWPAASHWATLTGHTDSVGSVAFSPDGKTLASGSSDNTSGCGTWPAASPWATAHRPHRPVLSVAFSPDGKTLASGSDDRTIKLWDVASRQPLGATLTGHTSSVRAWPSAPTARPWPRAVRTGPSSCGTWPAASTWASPSPATPTRVERGLQPRRQDPGLGQWRQHRQPVGRGQPPAPGPPLRATPDPCRAWPSVPTARPWPRAVTTRLSSCGMWPRRQPLGQPLTGHTDSVQCVAFSPDGKTLASGSGDNTIILWDVASRAAAGPTPQRPHQRRVSVAFSPDGKTLASGSEDKTISCGMWPRRQPLGHPSAATPTACGACLQPRRQDPGLGQLGQTIILWDVASRQPLGHPSPATPIVQSIAFSPDGKTLASGSDDNTLILWDVASREPLGPPLTGHTNACRAWPSVPTARPWPRAVGTRPSFCGMSASTHGKTAPAALPTATSPARSGSNISGISSPTAPPAPGCQFSLKQRVRSRWGSGEGPSGVGFLPDRTTVSFR